MKKVLLLWVLNCLTMLVSAQNIYICKDGNYTKTSITNGLEIDLSAGIDSITFSKPDLLPTVKIVYSGTSATVTIPEGISEYVTCSSGTSSNVVLTNTNTTDEYAYAVSGSSSAGSLTIAADYKMTVKLNGVESHVFLFAVRIAVLFFAGVAALTTAGIGGSAALLAFGIVLGAFAVAFAIAFGLGGRNFAERKLEEWDREHSGDKKDSK